MQLRHRRGKWQHGDPCPWGSHPLRENAMSLHASIRCTVIAFFILCATPIAHAQVFRAYLSPAGADSNPCTLASPCRLLPAALAAVADGGEIWMLDSANYNTATVSITKSVTILAVPGAVGSVVSINGAAITVDASAAAVTLRNLVLVPLPGSGGAEGIRVNAGTRLTVEDTLVAGHSGNGIIVFAPTLVRILNSTLRDNGASGIDLEAGSTAEISGSRFMSNGGWGIGVNGNAITFTTAAISDCVISGNSKGVYALAFSATNKARAYITRSTITDNVQEGVRAETPAGTVIVTVANNLIAGNAVGLSVNGAATIETLANNTVRQNGTPIVGSLSGVSSL
jgi:hypothetical protein